ncbi:hypothetical protein ABZ214_33245, partial [Streptomyces iakyrus]
SIQRESGASFSQIQWITAGYALAFAAGLITGGARPAPPPRAAPLRDRRPHAGLDRSNHPRVPQYAPGRPFHGRPHP